MVATIRCYRGSSCVDLNELRGEVTGKGLGFVQYTQAFFVIAIQTSTSGAAAVPPARQRRFRAAERARRLPGFVTFFILGCSIVL